MKSCPLSDRCGGCFTRDYSYERDLAYKQELLEHYLYKFAEVAPILGMDDPLHYRNKVQAVFGTDRSGRVISGIYRPGTHIIVPVRDCLLEDRVCDNILGTIRRLVGGLGISVYDEDRQTGFLRHVLLRRSPTTGQIMVVLVAGTARFPQRKGFVGNLLCAHPDITTILLNVNNEKTSMVLSDKPEILLHGPGYIEDEMLGLRFCISAKSFYQVNPVQAARLYTIAMRMARLDGTQSVFDAYCGTGTIGLIAATHGAKRVLGIELSPDAVRDAEQNARQNGIANAAFVCADASVFIKSAVRDLNSGTATDNVFRPDVVFLDPPRSGSTEQFLSALIRLNPQKVVYISCNPQTLERDLRYILDHSSYRVGGIQGVDMFPFTDHVETVCLLTHTG